MQLHLEVEMKVTDDHQLDRAQLVHLHQDLPVIIMVEIHLNAKELMNHEVPQQDRALALRVHPGHHVSFI